MRCTEPQMERHIELTFSIFYVGLHICTNMIVFRQLFCDVTITSHILTSTWTCMDASQHASSPRHLVLAEPIVGGQHARDHMLPKDSSEEEPMWSTAFFFQLSRCDHMLSRCYLSCPRSVSKCVPSKTAVFHIG